MKKLFTESTVAALVVLVLIAIVTPTTQVAEAAAGASPLNSDVVTVGHSLIDKVDYMVKDLVRDDDGTVQRQSIPGATLWYNWDNSSSAYDIDARSVLAEGNTEVLVFTEAIALKNHITWSNTYDYAASWYNLAVDSNSDTQVYLYETWHCINSGRPAGCEWDDDSHIPWRERLDESLSDWEGIAASVNAQRGLGDKKLLIIPGGQAMAALYDEIEAGDVPGISTIDDLFEDDIHPNDYGVYFIAMVFYATIYNQDPSGLPTQLHNPWGTPFDPPSLALATKMQEVAWSTVQNYSQPVAGLNAIIAITLLF